MNKFFIVSLITSIFPNRTRNFILSKALGWNISATAEISRLAFLNVRSVNLGPGSKIRAMTYAKGLDSIVLGAHARIGRLNWITGFPSSNLDHFSHVQGRDPVLILGDHASITNRHLIDCTDRVEIGAFSTFAGFRSQILTHSIDLKNNIQHCRPVKIGEYSFVGTGTIILGGAILPNRSILAAGSTLGGRLTEEDCLYGGSPVRKIKSLSGYLYFSRNEGSVK